MRKFWITLCAAFMITGTAMTSFANNGVSANGWVNTDQGWELYNNGEKQTGWQQDAGNWYYMNEAGIMETGWIDLNGVWYYLYPDGHMASGESLIGDKMYTFNASGAYQFEGIHRDGLDDDVISEAVVQYYKNYDAIYDEYLRINADREARGLSRLELHKDMCIASMYRCLHMIKHGYYDHMRDGVDCANEAFLGYTGTFVDISENLNRGTDRENTSSFSEWGSYLHDGLMNSKYHSMNILRPPYKRVGVGIVLLDGGKRCYLTQMFTARTDF